jgi:hypothetical protein
MNLLERSHQADMVHKILHGRGGLDYTTWFEMAGNGPRATRNTADPYNLRVKHGIGPEKKILQHPKRTGTVYQQK